MPWNIARKTVLVTGATIVQLAASPDLEGTTGLYFEEQRPISPSPLAQDDELARPLWSVSATMTDLHGDRGDKQARPAGRP